jgi:Tfp pilus assembly protein PilF
MPRSARPSLATCVAAWLALACGAPPGVPPPTARPDLAASLVELGERSLEAGELGAAGDRFARALEADPGSSTARLGLGRTALATGDLAGAQAQFEAALARDPAALGARLGLAEVARRRGRAAEARAELARVVEADPWRAEAHAGLAELTGAAPRTPPADLEDALRRAREHPYDVAAGLAAGTALADAGRSAEAGRQLESVLWLSDLDPQAAHAAFTRLGRLDPAWRARRAVRVDSFADESIRARPAWRFRLRLAWLAASQALDPLLGVRFLPATFGEFASREASDSLEAIDAAFRAQVARVPAQGILAAFTGRAPPRGRGEQRLGQAEFLGRRLVVRLEDEPGPSRVLLHELLHLYGAVHVGEEIESLMNPSGGALTLDPLNARIVGELRGRLFHGALDPDVFAVVDLESATRAYEDALRTNLALRRAGLAEAVEDASGSRVAARRAAARVRGLDPHLGDVARFVSLLLWRGERPASAASLLEVAARLYGPRTPEGRRAAEDADRIWRRLATRGAP